MAQRVKKSFDQHLSDEVVVEEIKDVTPKEQAELIANKFAEVSQEYDRIKSEDIDIPEFSEEEIPKVAESEIVAALADMDANKSNVKKDIPAKVLKHFAKQLGKPVTDLINTAIRQGCWPDIYKIEMVTPIPKCFHPKM